MLSDKERQQIDALTARGYMVCVYQDDVYAPTECHHEARIVVYLGPRSSVITSAPSVTEALANLGEDLTS